MPRYTDDSRERVRDAVDFAELVGARTELKASGPRRLTGLCPFHDERTPSFGIDPVEKLYHCFGCGVGGDVFAFVMETEGVDFGEALELLADRYGVTLERTAEDAADAARRTRRERLLALLERTSAFYERLLWESAEAQPARDYLARRGLGEEVLRAYRVGYAPSAWDKVLVGSRRAGYSEEELLAAGLVLRGRSGGVYDRFRRRITFPLADERGRILGFGARALGADQEPKYLNSAEGEVFHKREQLYGLHLARASAARAGKVVLCEGYTDVLALHQAGIENAIGVMGTAITEEQVRTLSRRVAPTLLFCLDADSAGQSAMAAAAASLQADRRGEVLIVGLPQGADPADLLAERGVEAMRALLDAAQPFARFRVERALGGADLGTLAGRERALDEAAAVIAELRPGVLREDLVRLVADRIAVPAELVMSAAQSPDARSSGDQRERAPGQAGGGAPVQGQRGGSPGRGRDGGWSSPGRRPAGGRAGARPGEGRWTGERSSFGRQERGSRLLERPGEADEGAHTLLDRRERAERAFLALCLALPEEGERRLAEADLEALFSAPATRRAAAHLRGNLRSPAASLPRDDEPLARVVAELVVRAAELDATPAALDLEALQLDLARLDREIADARSRSEGSRVRELAGERQRVLDVLRHRLQ
jgi:DNA primase